MIRTVLTLRSVATSGLLAPAAGDLMKSETGKTLYRITGVARLRLAGSNACRFRLTYERWPVSEAPSGTPVHPWRCNRRSPAHQITPVECHQEPPERRGVAPRTPAPRKATGTPQRPRIGRNGKERHLEVDLGPSLRRRVARDADGTVIREADVVVDDAASDPLNPSRRLRRAKRQDTIDTLRRAGSIGPRAVDAADELRQYLEHSVPAIGGGLSARSGNQPFGYQPITDIHIRASSKLRAASAALGEPLWPVVLWICLGGTVRGYADHRRMDTHAASSLVWSGMERLAEHFYGKAA